MNMVTRFLNNRIPLRRNSLLFICGLLLNVLVAIGVVFLLAWIIAH